MSDDRYVWDDDFNSFFELNADDDYENLSKVTVAKTLNEQDQRINGLERQLKEARRKEKAYLEFCNSLFFDIDPKDERLLKLKEQLKEKGDE